MLTFITEIGGTVGDIESSPFIEAIRQVKSDVGADNVAYIHVTLMDLSLKSKKSKTKPTQNSVNQLNFYLVFSLMLLFVELNILLQMKLKKKYLCSVMLIRIAFIRKH